MKAIKSGVYTTEELTKFLGNRMAVVRFVDSGEIVRASRGFYHTPDIASARVSALIAQKYFPEGVVSKQTILRHYNLDAEPDHSFCLDVDADASNHGEVGGLELFRSKKINFSTVDSFHGVSLKCYIPERAVFEILILQKGVGAGAQVVAKNFFKHFGFSKATQQRLHECSEGFGERGQTLIQLIASHHQESHDKHSADQTKY